MSDGEEQQRDGGAPSGSGGGGGRGGGDPVPTNASINLLAGSLASAMFPVLATAMESLMDKLDMRLAAMSGAGGGGGMGPTYTTGQHPGINRGRGHGGHDAVSSSDPYSLGSR